ncbi:MAG: YicC family protein [Deltaproteobacteria bacterium]|nr:YicC family protein [Deltaproteobacteria bacterium]
MNSMTGFGRGEASNATVTVVIEIKSVNNRFRDVQVRVPREYNAFESRIANLAKDAVQRGRLEISVRRTCTEGATRIVPDMKLVEQYRLAIAEVSRRLQRDPNDIPLQFILGQAGVLVAQDNDADALAEWDLVEGAVAGALADLAAMRTAEGRALARDLERHLVEMRRLCGEIDAATAGVAERLQARIRERVARLFADKLDPARIAQEAALLADKSDVSEELARLSSHCDQFDGALGLDEPVGRKLDFVLQEMHREVNTLGSKATEQSVSVRVVELKSVLERMREQAANVE